MCFLNDGYAEFQRDSTPRARKARPCSECDRAIQPGETYHRCVGKFDGSLFDTSTCATCERARHVIQQHELDEGCSWDESWCPTGELSSYLAEHDAAADAGADAPGAPRLDAEALAIHGSLPLAMALQRLALAQEAA